MLAAAGHPAAAKKAARRGGEPPQLQLDCLAALWRRGELSAAGVRAELAARGRPLAINTVVTVLTRLRGKGLIGGRRLGRSRLFFPLISRDGLRALAVERVARNYFDSADEFRRYVAAGGASPSVASYAAPSPASAASATAATTASADPQAAAPAAQPNRPAAARSEEFDASLL